MHLTAQSQTICTTRVCQLLATLLAWLAPRLAQPALQRAMQVPCSAVSHLAFADHLRCC